MKYGILAIMMKQVVDSNPDNIFGTLATIMAIFSTVIFLITTWEN